MAQGEATPAGFVSQLGNPSLLSLTTQRQCQPRLERSSSGVLCCVAWPAEVLSVREPRSQQPTRDARDSQGLGRCLSHQTPQQMRENLLGITGGRESQSRLCFRKTTLGWDVRCTVGWGALSGPDGGARPKIGLGPGLWV